jgi:cellulose biosynthesis protein BcsQ
MKSIAFFNNKGGVGKTTLLCNLASYLAVHHRLKVLVIDADPQSNATAYLLDDNQLVTVYDTSGHSTINLYQYYDSVARGKGFSDACPFTVASSRFGINVLPGHPSFALREDLLSKDWSDGLSGQERGLQTTFTFRHLLNQFPSYDLVFVDMGPSLGAINRSILLATDYFLTPMSVDLYSLMAIDNIVASLTTWRDDLETSLKNFERKNHCPYNVDNAPVRWRVAFVGYVMQQYRTKSIRGERAPVKSFESLIRKFDPAIANLENAFGIGDVQSANLGQIPSLSSLVPMSQLARAPIFDLGSADGVVGGHFAAVDDARLIYESISMRLLSRLSQMTGGTL